MVERLATGYAKFFTTFDDSKNWKFLPIEKERRFPFRIRANVEGRIYEMSFRMNPVELIKDGSGEELRHLFLKIMDFDNDNEVLFEDVVVEGLMFKIADLYLYFQDITIKEENMLSAKDYGGNITMGVALELD